MRQNRSAFTRLELLVIIVVGTTIATLLFPALGRTHHVHSRSICKNNLKQIGLGLHNYADTYNEILPPGMVVNYDGRNASIDGDSAEAVGAVGWSWRTMLLPFVDQSPISNRLTTELPLGATKFGTEEQRQKNNEAVGTWFALSTCPNDDRPQFTTLDWSNGNPPLVIPESPSTPGIATTSYYGNGGSFEETITHASVIDYQGDGPGQHPLYRGGWANPKLSNGVFSVNSSVTLSDIGKDGTSYTIGVGEVSGLKDPLASQNSSWYGAIGPGGTVTTDTMLSVMRTGEWRMNSPSTPFSTPAERSFSSEHVSGAQFMFMDGTVHFISENVELFRGENITNKSPRYWAGCDWQPTVEPIDPNARGGCGEGAFGMKTKDTRDYMDNNYGVYQRLFSRNDSLIVREF